MPRKRGQRSQPTTTLPPRRFFRTRVEVAELVRDGHLSHLDACALIWLHMFDWQGTGTVPVSVKELARWLNVRRETASRALARLAQAGLIERPDGHSIRLRLLARDRGGSPPHPIGGGGYDLPLAGDVSRSPTNEPPDRARLNTPPPPSLSSLHLHGPARDRGITQPTERVTEGSRDAAEEAVPPALAAVCAHIGVETPEGIRALAHLGVGPRRLLHWHSERSKQGSGVGSMVKMARTAAEQARRRLQALSLPEPWLRPDFCPRCGASWQAHGLVPDACPACHAAFRLCHTCRELAPAGAPCPYCGAAAEPQDAPVAEPEAGIWVEAKALLQEMLDGPSYRTWIRDVHLLQQDAEGVVLAVPNAFARDWLRSRLDGEIRQALAQVLDIPADNLEVRYVIRPRPLPVHR